MAENNPIVGGVYRHFKNPDHLYEVIAVAKNSETLEDMVVYKALYADEYPAGQTWARPAAMWSDLKNGVPRFQFAGEKDH
jgi:hypothetical protein